jgi:hypothetical protein
MAQYITAKDQETMLKIIEEFMLESNDGQNMTHKANTLMGKLFIYLDKIAEGIISSPLYSYRYYGEHDDLMQEARWSLYKSILKKQWKQLIPKKDEAGNPILDENGDIVMVKGASFFSFCSTVVAKNLYSYTKKINKKDKEHRADQELDEALMDHNTNTN